VLLIYSPHGAEPRTWSFRPLAMSSLEAEAVEDVTGWTFPLFQTQFYAGRTRARRAALWVLLRREQPDLRFDAVEFGMNELGSRWEGGSEEAELRGQVQDDPDLTEEQRAQLLAQLEPADPDPEPATDDGGEGEPGKADATEHAGAATSG
jgi:hypothetical protein